MIFFIIAVAERMELDDDWVNSQLTHPRDDLFRSLANETFYFELLSTIRKLKTNLLRNTGGPYHGATSYKS